MSGSDKAIGEIYANVHEGTSMISINVVFIIL